MTRTALLWLILVLAFIGIADSAYLTQSAYTQTPLTCSIGGGLDGCNTVAQSSYSHLFGIPLGLYGMVFYVVIFILAAVGLVQPGLHARRLLYLLNILGAAASVVFILIQIFLIKALCIYCLGSALLAFILCYLAWYLYKRVLPLPTAPNLPVVEPW